MNVLLSIKPEYAEKVLSGTKEYEFRRTGFRHPSKVNNIVLYATNPEQRILGLFCLSDFIEASPDVLWDRFGHASGISDRDTFMEYFSGTSTGYALEVGKVTEFNEPFDPKKELDDFNPPMSFHYLNGEFDSILEQV